jgi:hypothetical protein
MTASSRRRVAHGVGVDTGSSPRLDKRFRSPHDPAHPLCYAEFAYHWACRAGATGVWTPWHLA